MLNVAGLDVKGHGRQRSDLEARERFDGVIDAHAFNSEFTLTIPCLDELERKAADALLAKIERRARRLNASFYVARVPLALFLNPEFVSQYVKSGGLTALSTGYLDADDVVCLDGQGMLILNVTKDTYQVLGLTGRPSRFALGSSGRTGDRKSGPVERYIIEIPLLDPTFVAGKPGWKRVQECFERWSQIRRHDGVSNDGRWTVVFAADNSRQSVVFPSELVGESDIDQLELEVRKKVIEDVWLPEETPGGSGWAQRAKHNDNDADDADDGSTFEDWSRNLADFAEWHSLATRGGGAEGVKTYFTPPSLPINSYTPPDEPHKAGAVATLRLRGFLHPSMIKSLFATAGRSLDSSFSRRTFAVCSASGFAHSPVRWRSHDPGWGLAFGAGRSPAGNPQNGGKKHARGGDAMDLDDEDDGDGGDSDSSSSSSSSSFDLPHSSSTPLHLQTGRKARQKRHRLSKRKGAMRKGEVERSAASDGTNSGTAGGGEAGWTCIVHGRAGDDAGEASSARLVWWENVQGDTRS